MKFGRVLAALVATSLLSAPVAAQAAAAERVRMGSAVEGEELAGGNFIVPLLALVAVVLGVVALASDGDDDVPVSP